MPRVARKATGDPRVDLEIIRVLFADQQEKVAMLESILKIVKTQPTEDAAKKLQGRLRSARKRLDALDQEYMDAVGAVIEEQKRRNLLLTVDKLADAASTHRVFEAIRPLEVEAGLREPQPEINS